MAKFQLADDQKQLLHSVVEEVKRGSRELLILHDRGNLIVHLLQADSKGTKPVWEGVSQADLDDFERYQFVRCKGLRDGLPASYTVNKQRIIDACDSGFELPEAEQPITQKIYHIDNSGIVNIESTLQEATQIVHNAQALNVAEQAQLSALIEQLKQELKALSQDNPVEAEAITTHTAFLAQEVGRDKPNKLTLYTITDGLSKLAVTQTPVTVLIDAIVKIVSAMADKSHNR